MYLGGNRRWVPLGSLNKVNRQSSNDLNLTVSRRER